MAEVANLCFLPTSRADHFASCRGELLRGKVAHAAMWNGAITMLTYNQPVTKCIVSALQLFSTEVAEIWLFPGLFAHASIQFNPKMLCQSLQVVYSAGSRVSVVQ